MKEDGERSKRMGDEGKMGKGGKKKGMRESERKIKEGE